jgi:hypothetical protein
MDHEENPPLISAFFRFLAIAFVSETINSNDRKAMKKL